MEGLEAEEPVDLEILAMLLNTIIYLLIYPLSVVESISWVVLGRVDH